MNPNMTPALAVPKLPEWQCHKRVQAARIVALRHPFDNSATANGVLDTGATVVLPAWWMGKHEAKVGGYLVVYEDGYASYSPGPAFEGGYTRLGAEPQVDPSVGAALACADEHECVQAAARPPTRCSAQCAEDEVYSALQR